jgi:predicted RNase H-like HicB family nuclease
MEYLVIIEEGPTSFSAYVPDLPGCVAAAETRDETLALIQEAIEFHIEEMKSSGEDVPPPTSHSELVRVRAVEPGDATIL